MVFYAVLRDISLIRYGESKPDSTRCQPTTICSLLADLPTKDKIAGKFALGHENGVVPVKREMTPQSSKVRN